MIIVSLLLKPFEAILHIAVGVMINVESHFLLFQDADEAVRIAREIGKFLN